MGNSGSTSSDLAKGKTFLEILLYVQHVDENKDTASKTPDRYLKEYLLSDRRIFDDLSFTEYLRDPKANLIILKRLLNDRVTFVKICSNPLPNPRQLSDVPIHEFVVFMTENTSNGHLRKTWWSLETNGHHIVLQQSSDEDDVINKIYDTKKGQSVKRLGPLRNRERDLGPFSMDVENVLRAIWNNNQLSEPYHTVTSNSQLFASFIIEKITGEKWSTAISAIVVDFKKLKNKKIHTGIKVDTDIYKSILNDNKLYCYKAMIDERRKDFEKLTNGLTIETLNSVDSQGYTLLEWATVFSTSHWPIDEELKKKGAKMTSGQKESFRRNVFFIALQYLPPNKKTKLFDSIDKFDIHGVNKTGDTALHLSLYGEKWKIAEEILCKFEDFDVNRTNSLGDTPLLLAAKLKCGFELFNEIVHRTNSENVNKTDGNGWTSLHYAIDKESENDVEELLKREDVDVNITNNEGNSTALLLASKWRNIPINLFKVVLDKSTSDTINKQDEEGATALHYAMIFKSETNVNELLTDDRVDVNVKSNSNITTLHLASYWSNIPMDLYKKILNKSRININGQNKNGWTALHIAFHKNSHKAIKMLLANDDVNVNIKNNENRTPLHCATMRKDIPIDLYLSILDQSTSETVNAKDKDGNTALHLAILLKFNGAVNQLLSDDRVDVDIKNNAKDTALCLASKLLTTFPVDLFQKIIEKSADVNTKDKDGNTPLHIAILRKSEFGVKELLKHKKVSVDVVNNLNQTVYHHASRYWPDIPEDLLKIILKKSRTGIEEFMGAAAALLVGEIFLLYLIKSK